MPMAMQDNIFEWHFAVRGPADSEFQVSQTPPAGKHPFLAQ